MKRATAISKIIRGKGVIYPIISDNAPYPRTRIGRTSIHRERNSAKKKQAAELKKAEKRKAEVDGLFAKMYEDWSAGRITEYNFNMLSEKYQNEQKELETKIRLLHETMEAAVQTAADAEKWIALMKQYVNPVELTAELLNTLIEKITVHEAVKGEDGSREQEVEIYYRFIGKID